MRLSSLTSLHPGWEDVLRLDALVAQARNLPAVPVFSAAPLPAIAEPPPLPGATVGLGNLASEERSRIQQVAGPAMRRIDNLRNTLDLRDRRRLTERQQVIRTGSETDILDHVNASRKQEEADKQAIIRRDHPAIRDAWLKQYAFETQVAAIPPGPAALKAQDDLNAAKANREALEAASQARQDAVTRAAEAARADYQRRRRAEADTQVQEFQRALAAQTAREVRDSQHVVDLVLSKLEPLEPPVIRAATPVPSAQLESPTQVAASARTGPQPQIHTASMRSIADLVAERERLTAFIESDLQRRIAAVAAQRNWKIRYSPAPGIPDLTGKMADILRGSWKP